MSFRVILEPRAEKALDALDRRDRTRMAKAFRGLAQASFAMPNVKALAGGGYRLRVGDYRALYRIEQDVLLIVVVKVGHRRDVYRDT